MRNLWGAIITLAVVGVSFLGIPLTPAMAQEAWQGEKLVEGSNLELWGIGAGRQGLRAYTGPTYYGLPLNYDYAAPKRPDWCELRDGGTMAAGRSCTLWVAATNTTGETIPTSRAHLEHRLTPSELSWTGYLSNSDDWVPGEVHYFPTSVTPESFDEPGNWLMEFRIRVSSGTESSYPFDELAFQYQVEASRAGAPQSGFAQITSGQVSIAWTAPQFDGGTPVTGYEVFMIKVPDGTGYPSKYFDHEPWVKVCDFSGRPELQICDAPNNNVRSVPADDYLFAIYALNAAYPDSPTSGTWYALITDSLTVPNTLTNNSPPPPPPPIPTSIPAATPPPTQISSPAPVTNPEPVATPPVVEEVPIVQVESYGAAPNIASLVEAYDYSNSLDAPVLRLYQAYFNRRPDLGGAKYWLGIRRQGYDLGQIAGFMAGSDEFRNAYFGTTNAAYVAKVYTNVLGRAYDQAGYDYWLDLLNTNQTNRVTTVFYITANKEFINAYPFTNDHPDLTITSCDSRAETVVIRNNGDATVNLAGWKLNDRGPQFVLGDIGKLLAELAPGGSVEFRSGRTPALPSQLESFIWSDRDIWNNTGDTAYLVSSEGRTESQLDCQ